MKDIKIVENGNGGDWELKGNDLAMIDGFQNMPYLAMFGGNVEASTSGPKIPDEQALDWWGNNLLDANNYSVQMNSELERMLNNVALSSEGRLLIKQAAMKDLQFMTAFSILTVDVSLPLLDRVKIEIKIQEPTNKQSTEFVYLWDATKQELTIES